MTVMDSIPGFQGKSATCARRTKACESHFYTWPGHPPLATLEHAPRVPGQGVGSARPRGHVFSPRAGKRAGFHRGAGAPDTDREPQLPARPEPCAAEALAGAGLQARGR